MSRTPRPDELLWRGTIRSVTLTAFVVAVLGILSMLTVILNDTAAPEKQIHGYGWIAYAALMVLIALTVVNFMWVTAEVRRDGFFIGFGPLNWPRKRIGWARVAQVEKIDVRPTQWGGFGFRAVPWKRATAVVLRRGEGLKFELAGKRYFVITLDNSAAALAAIERALHPESEHHCDHDHH